MTALPDKPVLNALMNIRVVSKREELINKREVDRAFRMPNLFTG